jgi:hypothetical protein
MKGIAPLRLPREHVVRVAALTGNKERQQRLGATQTALGVFASGSRCCGPK